MHAPAREIDRGYGVCWCSDVVCIINFRRSSKTMNSQNVNQQSDIVDNGYSGGGANYGNRIVRYKIKNC